MTPERKQELLDLVRKLGADIAGLRERMGPGSPFHGAAFGIAKLCGDIESHISVVEPKPSEDAQP